MTTRGPELTKVQTVRCSRSRRTSEEEEADGDKNGGGAGGGARGGAVDAASITSSLSAISGIHNEESGYLAEDGEDLDALESETDSGSDSLVSAQDSAISEYQSLRSGASQSEISERSRSRSRTDLAAPPAPRLSNSLAASVEFTPWDGNLRERTPRERTPRERTPRERTPRERTPRERTPRERTPKERTPLVYVTTAEGTTDEASMGASVSVASAMDGSAASGSFVSGSLSDSTDEEEPRAARTVLADEKKLGDLIPSVAQKVDNQDRLYESLNILEDVKKLKGMKFFGSQYTRSMDELRKAQMQLLRDMTQMNETSFVEFYNVWDALGAGRAGQDVGDAEEAAAASAAAVGANAGATDTGTDADISVSAIPTRATSGGATPAAADSTIGADETSSKDFVLGSTASLKPAKLNLNNSEAFERITQQNARIAEDVRDIRAAVGKIDGL